MIPRPETEDLVSWIISDQKKNDSLKKILDIGTGSGCIAIALAKNLPEVRVSALDYSIKALNVASKNAEENKAKVHFFEIDILNATSLPDSYDMIVSNPPYVRELDKSHMAGRVLNYEPHSALFVQDKDPLIFYYKIANLAKLNLTKNGSLYFEINEYLSKELKELLENNGYQDVIIKKDIFGKERMIKCRLNE